MTKQTTEQKLIKFIKDNDLTAEIVKLAANILILKKEIKQMQRSLANPKEGLNLQ